MVSCANHDAALLRALRALLVIIRYARAQRALRAHSIQTHYVEDRAGRLISGSRQPRPVDHFIQAAFRLPKPTSARSNNDDARTQYDMYRARGSLPWRVTAVEDAPTLLDRVARSTVEEAVKHAQVEMESVQKRFQLAM